MRCMAGMVRVAKRLTDKEKKQIIADYVESGSYNATARMHQVAPSTVKRLCERMPEAQQKAMDKKEQNTADILAYMDGQKDKVCSLLDKYLDAMGDRQKIERAGIQQLATAMAIVIDKYAVTAQNEQAIKKLDELMDKVGGVI